MLPDYVSDAYREVSRYISWPYVSYNPEADVSWL